MSDVPTNVEMNPRTRRFMAELARPDRWTQDGPASDEIPDDHPRAGMIFAIIVTVPTLMMALVVLGHM